MEKSKWASASYDVEFFAKESVIFGIMDDLAHVVISAKARDMRSTWIDGEIKAMEIGILRIAK